MLGQKSCQQNANVGPTNDNDNKMTVMQTTFAQFRKDTTITSQVTSIKMKLFQEVKQYN